MNKLFLLGAVLIANNMVAQTLLNGSFESTTAPAACNYNMTNATYNSYISNSTAFGLYEQMDIVVSGCYIPSVPNGTYAISLANNPTNNLEGEAVSLELSSPLTIGNSYEISLKAFANTDFGPQGDLLIGISNINNSFGNVVDTINTVVSTWTSFTLNFIATTNATHITVMPIPGVNSWNFVDDFSITEICSFITGTDTRTECNTYTWIDGNTYSISNNTATYNIVGGAANGCDSLVTLDLTVVNSASGTDTRTECNSYTWIDGINYTANNNTATYNIVGGAANGCDSLVTLNLTINSVLDLTTSVSGLTISANNTGATYKWLDCDNNYSLIAGETGQSFSATANGNYAVELTENGCVDTTNCVAITTVGILENSFGNNLLAYPNPTNGNFTIDLGTVHNNSNISITDISGKLIESKNITQSQIINLSLEEPAGMYIISIQTEEQKAVIRLIKE